MPRLAPDYRYRRASDIAAGKIVAPDDLDDRELALVDAIRGSKDENPVYFALQTYKSQFKREVMQAWFVGGASDKDANEVLLTPREEVSAYRFLFFDPTVFRDRLDMLAWVQEYHGTPYGESVLKQAVIGGVDTLRWLFAPAGSKVTEPKKVLEAIMSDAYYRGQTMRMFAGTSKEAAAAHGFMQTALKTATTLLQEKTGNDDFSSLVIKLKHKDGTAQLSDEEKPDLMH